MIKSNMLISLKTLTGFSGPYDVMEVAIPIIKKHFGTRYNESVEQFFADIFGNLGHNIIVVVKRFKEEHNYYAKNDEVINLALNELYRQDCVIYNEVEDGYYTLEFYSSVWEVLFEVFEQTKNGDETMSLYYDATKAYILIKNQMPKLRPFKIQIKE